MLIRTLLTSIAVAAAPTTSQLTTSPILQRASRAGSRRSSKPESPPFPVGRLKSADIAALAVLPLALSMAVASASAANVQPFVPTPPNVSAEIPWTPGSTPFNADGVYPEFPMPAGYTEKEFFFSGKASIYEFSATGNEVQVVSPCPASVTGEELPSCTELPYTDRMLIVMPTDPHRFSGNVWVNPFNPSANYDYRQEFNRSMNYHVRNGDIYVQWSSKSVSVDALKTVVDPVRYDSLYWPYNPATPGSNSAPYDGITYEIAAQLGLLFKQNGAASPIRDYKVKHVFETGFSQDGGFAFTQANVFHHLMRMPGGRRIYDGYVPQGSQGTSDINLGLTPRGTVADSDPRYKMGPRDAPVIKINTETELAGYFTVNPRPVDWRRPDGDAPNDDYREWEVPGSSHDDIQTLLDPSNITLYGVPSFPSSCDHRSPPNVQPTDFPYLYVGNAATEALVDWVTTGKKPAHGGRIEQTNLTTPSKTSILRDQYGNALGGVRTPYLEVPRSTYNVIDSGPGFCWSFGWSEPLGESTLKARYTTHRQYVREFTKSAWRTVAKGFWLPADARKAIKDAESAEVP